ncbi:DUF2975 domain-containing protein [Egicoccus sp. AB-alg2]|uniref:DUF2975 domain-containing protein n=1 Tax=Egicoccus sp. AB-alg2 TaxID=3242693 RepID=UPI00359E0DEB
MGSGIAAPERLERRARLLAGFVLAFGVLTFVGGLIVAAVQVADAGGAVAVVVDADLLGFDDVAGLPAGTSLAVGDGHGGAVTVESGGREGADAVLEVDRLPLALRLLAASPAVAIGVLTLAGSWLFSRLLREVAAGRPFAHRNVTRWRGMAATVLAVALLPSALGTLATVAVLGRVDPAGDAPVGFTILDLPLLPLLLVAALLVMAEVFRHGGALADDVEGLV